MKAVSAGDGYTRLNWKAATDNDKQNAPMYVVYASDTYPVDITNPENILVQNLRDTHYIYAPIRPWTAISILPSRLWTAVEMKVRQLNKKKNNHLFLFISLI